MNIVRRVLLLCGSLLCAVSAFAGEVKVTVDERIELLCIVARLAGAPEFNMPNSASPYADRVARHFGPLKDHAAIRMYQALRRDFGTSYDAVPSLALHLDGLPTLNERIPFDSSPPRLDARWNLERTREFIIALRSFAARSNAGAFFEREQAFYRRVEAKIAPVLAEAKAVEWFDSFFGAKPGASYVAIPGLLCGGGNYGVGVRFLGDSPEEVRPVLGIYEWDREGLPVYHARNTDTYVHELCHSYTNPIVDRHLEQLQASGTEIYPLVADRMSRMAYGSWQTLMYESLVRASVIRYLADVQGGEAASREADAQRRVGFLWVPALADLLAEYAAGHRAGVAGCATLDAFMPRIVQFFNEQTPLLKKELAQREAAAPKLVSIEPANGAVDVEPSRTTLILTFDRPMRKGGWSFVGSKENTPEILGQPGWNADRTVLTAQIRLVPGRTYQFSLNSDRFTGFQADDGTPLKPVEIRFSVKGL